MGTLPEPSSERDLANMEPGVSRALCQLGVISPGYSRSSLARSLSGSIQKIMVRIESLYSSLAKDQRKITVLD